VDTALHEIPSHYYMKCIGKNKKECYQCLEVILTVLKEKGIIASLAKIQEGMEIVYCGYVVSMSKDDGPITVLPCREKISALIDYPQPKTHTQLRRFLGLVNQLCSYLPGIQPVMTNLSQITSDKQMFVWLSKHTEEFNRVKEMISAAISLTSFDFQRRTFVQTDASNIGVGFLMYQLDHNDLPYVICVGSTSLKLKHLCWLQ